MFCGVILSRGVHVDKYYILYIRLVSDGKSGIRSSYTFPSFFFPLLV